MSDFLPFTRPDIDEDSIAEVIVALRSGWISSGPRVLALEAALSARFGGRPVRCLNSGTAALQLGLTLCGVGPGDEVITSPLSWVGTANVVLNLGARPVFVDIDPHSRNLDLNLAEAAISTRSKVLLPVDLAGLPVDRNRLHQLAGAHGLRVLEDAAQSIGANWQGRAIGSFGDLCAFSFHANKNLTTGEGGCLVLNDADELARLDRLRIHGVRKLDDGGYDCSESSGKYNLTDLAAALGLGQLKRLDAQQARRQALARRYFSLLAELPADLRARIGLPQADFQHSNWHMFQLILPPDGMGRTEFIAAMRQRGIGIGVHYPAIHLLTAYRQRGYQAGSCPQAESLAQRLVTLPLFPAMQDADVDRVVSALAEVLA